MLNRYPQWSFLPKYRLIHQKLMFHHRLRHLRSVRQGRTVTIGLENATQGTQQQRLVVHQQDQGFAGGLALRRGSRDRTCGLHPRPIGPGFGTLERPGFGTLRLAAPGGGS